MSVGRFPIILETTPIGSVAGHFGRGRVVDVRGGTEGDVQLCYVVRDSQAVARLTLYSDDMGGSDQDVMGFTLERRSARPSGCASLAVSLSDIVMDQGLRLGMTGAEVRQRLGMNPASADSAVLEYRDSVLYQAHRPATSTRSETYEAWTYFDVTARFVGGILVRVEVHEVTST